MSLPVTSLHTGKSVCWQVLVNMLISVVNVAPSFSDWRAGHF